MKKIALVLITLLVMPVYAADLTTFSAGNPILSSEINGNFAELEARINALSAQSQSTTAGIPGEPFNYSNFGTGYTLASGFDYYITDIIFEYSERYSCGYSGVIRSMSLSGNTLGVLIKMNTKIIPYLDSSANTCFIFGDQTSLITPIRVPGGEILTSTTNVNVRVIGYRIAQ